MTTCSPFKYFKTSPEIIRLAVMYYCTGVLNWGLYTAARPSQVVCLRESLTKPYPPVTFT
jgi:hypothetical protein